MRKCENCKHFFYDYSTGTSECGQYDNMTEEEFENYYGNNGGENCTYYEEDVRE